ncbi:TolC family protein [Arcobacter sp.]|uniref:TolC family protein n=1 Tax=Arcobacter sp. TaxID=1872629 RepID=UPI003D0E84EE
MKIIKIALLLLIFTTYSYSETLKNIVVETLQNNPKIKSIESNSKANKLYVDEAYGDYLPTLSYEAYIEDKKTISTPRSGGKSQSDVNGSNQQLKLEQVIYNGGLNGAKLDEAKHNYQAKLISNISETENVVLETTQSYLDYVKNLELLKLTKNNLEIQDKYLEIAVQTEQVSGDLVDRLLVENKILTTKEKLRQLENDVDNAKVLLQRYYPKDISSNACRPNVNRNFIPKTMSSLLEIGIKNNYKVLEEIENIKAQKAVLEQELSRFLPTIKFSLLKEIDDGVDVENVRKDNESARLTISYKLFNGLKDRSVYLREKYFFDESQRNLDDVSKDAKQKLQSEFTTYEATKERIYLIKTHVDKLKEILNIFEEQFDGGTKTFIDVLNQEEELYRKKSELIEEEFKNFKSYYNLLFDLSKLSDTIYSLDNNICGDIEVDLRVKKEKKTTVSNELVDMLSGDNNLIIDDQTKPKKEVNIKEKVNKIFNSLLDDIYNADTIEKVDLEKLKKKDYEKRIKKDEERIKKIHEKIDNEIEALLLEDENKSIEKNIIEKPKSEPVIKDEKKLDGNKILKEEFFKQHKKAYTIVTLTGIKNKIDENYFINKYKLNDNSYVYKFKTDGNDYIRVLYGFYDSVLEAEDAMSKLDEGLKITGPYVDNIKRHQFLYNKYKSSWGEKVE